MVRDIVPGIRGLHFALIAQNLPRFLTLLVSRLVVRIRESIQIALARKNEPVASCLSVTLSASLGLMVLIKASDR